MHRLQVRRLRLWQRLLQQVTSAGCDVKFVIDAHPSPSASNRRGAFSCAAGLYSEPMSATNYIVASLRQYRRVHLAVAAGVAVATAVITGALLVGDSMRGSLRDLVLQGLGRVDTVLLAEHPFHSGLASELLAAPEVKSQFREAVPLLLTTGAATSRDDAGETRRATGLSIYGVTSDFWSLASPSTTSKSTPTVPVNAGNEIALTADVAAELGVEEGDFIVLRIPLPGATPADSALGEKEDASASRRLKVTSVLVPGATDSMARFGLRPSQQAPRNAFVPLATLQQLLELDDKANALAFATDEAARPSAAAATGALTSALRPTLADYGLTVESTEPTYVRISADRLVLPPHVVDVASEQFPNAGLQPVVTYLANTIVAGDRKIPYSTVAGVDSTAALGPVLDENGAPIALADDEVALNDWAAKDLDAKVGDEITITYYEPETTHGVLREHEPLRLKLRAVVPLADADGRPTAAADPKFAPELPGVTDQDSIESWDLPFDLVEEVRDEDETYWDEHRTTPKAFISFNLAKRLWATRWGTVSVLRLPATGQREPAIVSHILDEKLKPADMGMTLLPVKQNALRAASGTTPFDGLFLGFSFFLMASALMLTALLFRLGVEGRVREIGLLLATGWSPARVRRILLVEAAIVAAGGAILGAVAGIAYAAVMVHGLNTWWVDATAAPFLKLHVTPRSLAIGLLAGLAIALLTIWRSLRNLMKISARQLLAGDAQAPLATRRAARWSGTMLPAACLVASLALAAFATRSEGEAQAGAFFGGGALALIGILAFIRGQLNAPSATNPTSLTLNGLAARNARRNPSRTLMSLALAATASFLIVALSAFRLAPTDRGTGGFDLLATSDLPLHYDLNTSAGRDQLGFATADSKRLADVKSIAFRVNNGEDASCLNLYQTTQPRVLGTPPELAANSDFQFAMSKHIDPPAPSPSEGRAGEGGEAGTSAASDSPWTSLDADLGSDPNGRPIIPMILDRNTAFYSLKLYALGNQLIIRDGAGQPVTLQIVGMLTNSTLQGDCIISEQNFLRVFPEVAGRRFFLIKRGTDSPPTPELASILETQLEDFGFDAIDARERLASLMAVQNTYLTTFQMLGGLGLILGAVGLAVVQLRSVLERRGELALMQAAGFRRRRLTRMVLAENLVLLFGGLAVGCSAALLAVLPHAAIEQVGVPWRTLVVLLAIVAVVGIVAALLAARSALRVPLIPALRGD
jgi:putative ABC transport system permease protein